MSKRGYIARYLLILKKLKSNPFSSFEELETYFANQLGYLQLKDDHLDVGFSKRTFQRDLREISNLFGIDIEYSKARKGYFVSQDHMENMNFQRMTESFDLFMSLDLSQDLKPYIHLEKRKSQGTENLYGLLHAIKNRLRVIFLYQKFDDEEKTKRTVHPYALKEFKNRWYLIAKDMAGEGLKSFALDRLTDLEITKKPFEHPQNFDVEETYRHCFGITGPNGMQPEEIVLSFTPHQGKYIKSLPLHETQQTIIDDDKEFRIVMKIHVTFDFLTELLSFGDAVKVLEPKSLVDEIKQSHERAADLYK